MTSIEECRKKSKNHFIGCDNELEIFKTVSDDILNFLISNENELPKKLEKAQLSCAKISHQKRLCEDYLTNYKQRYQMEDEEYNENLKICSKLNEQKNSCIGSIFCQEKLNSYHQCLENPSKKCEKLKEDYQKCIEINDILIRSTIITRQKNE